MPAKISAAKDPLQAAVTPLSPPRDAIKDDIDAAAAEDLAQAHTRTDLRAAARKRAPLLLGLGALAAVGIAVVIGRRPLAVVARTAVKRIARPAIARAAMRRPLEAARFVAHRPKLAARVAAALR